MLAIIQRSRRLFQLINYKNASIVILTKVAQYCHLDWSASEMERSLGFLLISTFTVLYLSALYVCGHGSAFNGAIGRIYRSAYANAAQFHHASAH